MNEARDAARAVMAAVKMENLPNPSGRSKTLAITGLMVSDKVRDKGMVRKAQLASAQQEYRDAAKLYHETWCQGDGPKRLYEKLAKMMKDGDLKKIPVMTCPSCYKVIKIEVDAVETPDPE